MCTAAGVNQAACSVTLCLIPLGQDFLLSAESHAGGYHTPVIVLTAVLGVCNRALAVPGVCSRALALHLGSVLISGPSAYTDKVFLLSEPSLQPLPLIFNI